MAPWLILKQKKITIAQRVDIASVACSVFGFVIKIIKILSDILFIRIYKLFRIIKIILNCIFHVC